MLRRQRNIKRGIRAKFKCAKVQIPLIDARSEVKRNGKCLSAGWHQTIHPWKSEGSSPAL
jgi:hypothetical protein